ncbi:MAG: hypothetical protein ABR529_02595 [Actinomycetota bacterium]
MHPMFVKQMADARIDQFHRESQNDRLVKLAKQNDAPKSSKRPGPRFLVWRRVAAVLPLRRHATV